MNILFKLFLGIHIIGGTLGLLAGSISIIRKKGDKKHVLVGKIFANGMYAAGFSALVLSIIHPNHFLFAVGVFTLYLVGTGNRYIYLKMLGKDQKVKPIDWTLTIFMLLSAIGFIGFGGYLLFHGNSFGIVLILFSIAGLFFVKTDFDNYKGNPQTKNYWLMAHIQRMTGGYIASCTAFLVVNSQKIPFSVPSTIIWLLPSLLLTPLIFSWTKKYKIK